MITNEQNKTVAPLYGLVLAGGRSTRMGQDKSLMTWHGREQRYYMADLLQGLCDDVYLSVRPDQQSEIDAAYKTIADVYTDAGPLAGILSAMSTRLDVAWLVTACDLPLLDTPTLQYLIDNRDASKMATTFYSPHDNLPEPLITIWEPGARGLLLEHLEGGMKCPRKALIRNMDHVHMLTVPNTDALLNANTPEDAERVRELLER